LQKTYLPANTNSVLLNRKRVEAVSKEKKIKV
jgi:hypothetical protein